jgi:hypothetical protein
VLSSSFITWGFIASNIVLNRILRTLPATYPTKNPICRMRARKNFDGDYWSLWCVVCR